MPFVSVFAWRRLLRNLSWALCVTCVLSAVGVVVSTTPMGRSTSDPRATLVVGQSILKTGSIRLDWLGRRGLRALSFAVHKKNEHYYGYFPLGSSLLALPAIAVLNHFEWDFSKALDEAQGQRFIVTAICIVKTLLLIRIARLYLSRYRALLVATLFWFGTTFASTEATALWSHDFATLLALVAIDSALRSRWAINWLLLASCSFLAYLCRPTFLLFAGVLQLYLWTQDRKAAAKYLTASIVFALCFVAFSYREFGQVLPDYYLPSRLRQAPDASADPFWTVLTAQLFSPGRGVLVYTPLLLVTLLVPGAAVNVVRREPSAALFAVCWPFLHLVAIARFPHWWGGHSFGPRLFTDALPGVYLLLCMTVAKATWSGSRVAFPALVVLGLLSGAIHTYQGLYNTWTHQWNVRPNIDKNSSLLFDWSYPQFLHTRDRDAERVAKYRRLVEPERRRVKRRRN